MPPMKKVEDGELIADEDQEVPSKTSRAKTKADKTDEAPKAKKIKKAAAEGDEEEDDGTSAGGQKVTIGQKAQAKGEAAIPRDATVRKPLLEAAAGVRLVHWNVAGLNALLKDEQKRARLTRLIGEEQPDVLALSEHKVAENKLEAQSKELRTLVPGYTAHWAVCTAKNGYSGVVALVRNGVEVIGAPLIDTVCGSLHEGRTVSVELADCVAVAAYVPNSGQKLERLDYRIGTWEPAMRAHLKAEASRSGKPVVLFGDLNVGHLDRDIWNHDAKHIPKSAGLTPRERAAFAELLDDGPYVDCFRQLWPDASGCFSYWSTRAGGQLLNRGLRLDYAVASASVSQADAPLALYDAGMLYEYAPKGDHCPTLVALRKAA